MKRTAVALAALLLAWGGAPAGRLLARPTGSPQPILDLSQRVPENSELGEPLTVELTLTNVGDSPAVGVRVKDILPAGTELLDASPVPEQLPGSVQWGFALLRPGERQLMRLRLTLKPGLAVGECRNEVHVWHQVEQNRVIPIALRRPELSLAVVGPPLGVVGESMPVQITVSNHGNSNAHHVTLAAVVPAGFVHPGGNDLENDIGDVPPGQSRTLQLPLSASAPTQGRLHVQMTAAGLPAVERDLTLEACELRADVRATTPLVCYPGWSWTCNFEVHNQGASVLPPSRLELRLPEELSFLRASGGGAYEGGRHTVVWELPECKPGEKHVLSLNGVARKPGSLAATGFLWCGQREVKQFRWGFQIAEGGERKVHPAP
jgi:uncharacterized repeat protein (TIGR01451 family)